MRAWRITIFLFASHTFSTKHALATKADEQIVAPTEFSKPGTLTPLSIDDVNSVLVTEVSAEYGTHRLLSNESHQLWTAAIDYEWSRARDVESSRSKDLGSRRRVAENRGTFPYLVCDLKKGKLGASCRDTVEHHFGKDIIVSLLILVNGWLSALVNPTQRFFLLDISQFVTRSIRLATSSAHALRWPRPRQILWW